MSSIRTTLSSYDLISLSETWLSDGCSSGLDIPGFNDIIRRERAILGGGVVVYVMSNIPFKRRWDLDMDSLELIWLEVMTLQGKLLIGTAYRPPNNRHFWSQLEEDLDHVKEHTNNAQIIVLGDLNSDFKTPNGRQLIETCISLNLQCHIDSSTRITKSTNSTCLDQIISNIHNSIVKCQVIPPISTNDHCTVTSEIHF